MLHFFDQSHWKEDVFSQDKKSHPFIYKLLPTLMGSGGGDDFIKVLNYKT